MLQPMSVKRFDQGAMGPLPKKESRQVTCVETRANLSIVCESLKGGDPAARSRTATLLRLHPSH